MRGAILVVALLWTALQVAEASASHGGPLLVRVLGWDPAAQRVYLEQDGADESGERDGLFHFDLRAADPGRAVVEPWSVGFHPPSDTARARRRAALLARLRPLDEELAPSFVTRVAVVSDSTVPRPLSGSLEVRRTVLDVWLPWGPSPALRVTNWDPAHDVRVLRCFALPGRPERLVLVSCAGDPHETGYEVQRAVILGPGSPSAQVLDGWRGAVP